MKLISFLFMAFVFTCPAFSQTMSAPTERTSVSYSQVAPTSSQGIRVSLLGSALNFDAKTSAFGHTSTFSDSMKSNYGFALGYAYLPVGTLGFTTSLAYMTLSQDSDTMNIVRLDGNMAFAFNRIFNLKGGINVSGITSASSGNERFTKLNPAPGGQVGLGAQISKNFGLDLMYVVMNQSGNVKIEGGTAQVEAQESGGELNLSGTF